jgi:transcriptional repressor NrdR
MLAQTVEESVRATGAAQIESNDIGLAILEPLRKLDEVAFMRFASVYQGWETLEDFEAAINVLRAGHVDFNAESLKNDASANDVKPA